MLCAWTQQIIRVLTGIKRNGLPISNTPSCYSVGRLRRKAFPTRNLITVIKEQRHQNHRLDALDSNDLKYHFEITIAAATQRHLSNSAMRMIEKYRLVKDVSLNLGLTAPDFGVFPKANGVTARGGYLATWRERFREHATERQPSRQEVSCA